MSRIALRAIVTSMVASSLAPACAPEDIVIASIQASDTNLDCDDSGGCAIDEFCAKVACQDLRGVCTRRPTLCDATAAPSCGCDGITYYNDCLRRAAGSEAAAPGECDAAAMKCGGSMHLACPESSYCAKLLPGEKCPADADGICWGLPSECGPAPPGDRWDPCQGAGACVATCDAIRSEQPHRHKKQCDKP